MLLCDFGNLEREVAQLEEAGVEAIHLDVMDGQFVPNITYGMPIVQAFRRLTDMTIDVHLMIQEPAKYASQFVQAGADSITFHIEAHESPAELLTEIQDMGTLAGLAINPSTDVKKVLPYLPACDLILVMSVEAGFGGQAFNESMLDRTRQIRKEFGPELLIEMDGGIGEKTIHDCCEAGADLLVVGSAIFGKPRYGDAIARLRTVMAADS
jgi:ribulose-phosphate 3-epimerase